MFPIYFKQPIGNSNLSDNGLPQTPDRSTQSQAAERGKDETAEMISRVKGDLCQRATEDGYIYATQIRENGLVKVGFAGVNSKVRPTDVTHCGFKPGKIFQTTNFQGAYRAEQLIHGLLGQWRQRHKCTRHKNKHKGPKNHKEYFNCTLGFAISAIDVVTTWFLKKPYLIGGGTGSLKVDWRQALNIFEDSQNSNHPMEWFEFFLIDLERQLSWKLNLPPLNSPRYLPAAELPVRILPNGTLRFALTKEEAKPVARVKPERAPNTTPHVPQTSPLTRQVRQRNLSDSAVPRHPESAPPKTSSPWDESSSPPETPSKPPKRGPRRSGKAPKPDPPSRSRGKGCEEDNSQDDEKEVDILDDEEEFPEEDDDGERTLITEIDDTGLVTPLRKLTLTDDGKSTGVEIEGFFISFESLLDAKSGRRSINVQVGRSSVAAGKFLARR